MNSELLKLNSKLKKCILDAAENKKTKKDNRINIIEFENLSSIDPIRTPCNQLFHLVERLGIKNEIVEILVLGSRL